MNGEPIGFLKDYETCEETIGKLYNSKLGLGILDALKDGPMRLADLRRAVNANAPNTSSKAKDLEDMGLVTRVGGDYQLTDLGYVMVSEVSEALKVFSNIEKYRKFWSAHDTSNIPKDLQAEFFTDMGWVMLESETDISENEDEIMIILSSMKGPVFKGTSDMYREAWVDLLTKKYRDEGVKSRLILHESVLQRIAKYADKCGYKEWF